MMDDLIKNLYFNEIRIDSFWRDKLSLGEGRVNYRPLKYKALNSSFLLYVLLASSWPILLLLSCCYFFAASLFFKGESIDSLVGKPVWIDSSLKSELIRGRGELSGFFVIDIRKCDYLRFISIGDKFSLFFKSVSLCLFSSGSVALRDKLQLIDLYRVVCFYEFIFRLNKVSDRLSMCNHYDRWAMVCYAAFTKQVEVWQHGVLDADLDLPVKLRNVRRIHCLAKSDVPIWGKYTQASDVDMVIQESHFMLTLGVAAVDFLMISHPAYMDEEIDLLLGIGAITKPLGVVLAYKPHPAYDYKERLELLRGQGVNIVPKEIFPKARLALTKGSTLGKEYESVGVKVLWHTDESAEYIAGLLFDDFRKSLRETNV